MLFHHYSTDLSLVIRPKRCDLQLQGKDTSQKALIVTATHVHYVVAGPVIEELKGRNWQVAVLRLERVWERIESYLMKRKRRSMASFYVKAAQKPKDSRTDLYVIGVASRIAHYSMMLLGVKKPDVVIVLTEGIMPAKIAVAAARLGKIPTLLLLQLGMLGKNYECPSFLADKISVPGDFIKDLVINCGVDAKRVVVTGRPTYDALVRAEDRFDRAEICRRLELNPARKILVYCTENLPLRDTEKIVRAICKAMKSLPDVQFIIKVHPSELSVSIYHKVAREVGVQPLITKEESIYEILFACDLMITGFSTTALDAMILDKPVITTNFTGLPDPIPFAESGAAIGVYREKDLEPAIREGLYHDSVKERLRRDREKFVYEQTYLKDGKATERIVDLIEQMVS